MRRIEDEYNFDRYIPQCIGRSRGLRTMKGASRTMKSGHISTGNRIIDNGVSQLVTELWYLA